MGISSSLNASVMGLNVNAQRLSGISDNIANSQTYGYKRAETDFSSLVNYGNSASFYNAGGVRASTVRQVTVQGSLIATGNSTDIAVNGRGLIPVTTVQERDEPSASRPFMLTTTGSFTPDDDGFLRTSGGLQLLGWPVDATGDAGAVNRDSPSDLQPVDLSGFDFAPNPTTTASLSVNLPTVATAGDTHTMTMEYFDAVGADHDIVIEYTSVDPALGAWTMTLTDSFSGSVVGAVDLTFAQAGDPTPQGGLGTVTATTGAYDPATGILTVAGASNPIGIDIGSPGSTANLTEFASTFAPISQERNGSPLGFLERVEMNEQGVLEGIYDTGLRRSLYRIPLADMSNPEGLTPEDNQAFSLSTSSGPMYLWDSGSGPTGNLNGYTLESSTTDITEELTQLIETQRAYSSNAKIVQTVDEMLQETTNLKR
jgi:flagellar hook protein FlgE